MAPPPPESLARVAKALELPVEKILPWFQENREGLMRALQTYKAHKPLKCQELTPQQVLAESVKYFRKAQFVAERVRVMRKAKAEQLARAEAEGHQ